MAVYGAGLYGAATYSGYIPAYTPPTLITAVRINGFIEYIG